jgi:hypothetical protein
VRARAAELAPLEISVPKLLTDPDRSQRQAHIAVEGAGLVLPLTLEEAQVLADDAARRVLLQLKNAGVRGRVRVEFELQDGNGRLIRDSRPGAVRKLARGEEVGASSERRERRRRSRSRGRRKPLEDGAEPVPDSVSQADALTLEG